MTISCERTGNLYLAAKTFKVKSPDKGAIEFNVQGYSAGMGGGVTVRIGEIRTTYHVLSFTKGVIHGVEFWGDYDDHPRRLKTPISFRYPD